MGLAAVSLRFFICSLFELCVTFNLKIERHLALGGRDDPAEVFFMFLFRYGAIPGFASIRSSARTQLSQLMVVESGDGGEADMGGVYQVDNCVKVFQACWVQLRAKVKQSFDPSHSILRFIVDSNDLKTKRRIRTQWASQIYQLSKYRHLSPSTGRSSNLMPSKNNSVKTMPTSFARLDTDEEASEILAGFGKAWKTKTKQTKAVKKVKTGSKAKKLARKLAKKLAKRKRRRSNSKQY